MAAEQRACPRGAMASRAAHMRLLSDACGDLVVADGMAETASAVLRAAAAFSACGAGCLLLIDGERGSARVAAVLGGRFPAVGTEFPLQARVPAGAACARALAACIPSLRDLLERDGVAIPFCDVPGQACGMLLLAMPGVPPALARAQRGTLDAFVAGLAAMVAMARQQEEQSRLHALLAERETRLDALVARLLSIQEDERRRLSIELHDGLAQFAGSASQHLQAFADAHAPGDPAGAALLACSMSLIRRVMAESRTLIAGLRPPVLDDFGLATAIEQALECLRADAIEVRFTGVMAGLRLAPEVETALFRVAEEALRNVRRHACASRVEVELRCQGGGVSLRIQDNGRGIAVRPRRTAGRLGLLGMQERMRQVGGSCRIDPCATGGVVVEARIAMARSA